MFYQCIEGELVIGVQRYVPERPAELFCLSKQVFRAFGSCNGHVTAITSGVELNVKGKFLLLFCCYCSTLQHCLGLNVGQPYPRLGRTLRGCDTRATTPTALGGFNVFTLKI